MEKPYAVSDAEGLLTTAKGWWDVDKSNFKNGDRFLRNLGSAGQPFDMRLGSSITPNTNDPVLLIPETSGYVFIPGNGGGSDYLEVPYASNLNTTQLDIVARFAVFDYQNIPNASWVAGRNNVFYCGFQFSPARLLLQIRNAAGSWYYAYSGASTELQNWYKNGNRTMWGRWTYTGGVWTFYWQYDQESEPSTWKNEGGASNTALGNVTTAYTDTLVFGSPFRGSANYFTGRIYRVLYKSSVGGSVVVDANCDAITSASQNTFTATTGQTVRIIRHNNTTNRNASPVPKKGYAYEQDQGHVMSGSMSPYNYGAVDHTISIENTAATNITGDIDIRALICPVTWSNSKTHYDVVKTIIYKPFSASDSYNASYRLGLRQSTYQVCFGFTPNDGTNTEKIYYSTSALVTSADQFPKIWVRATLDVDNGAGSRVVTFYTSTDGVTWASLGSTTEAGTSNISSADVPLYVGASGSSGVFNGKIYQIVVKDGIGGTTALNADFSGVPTTRNESFSYLLPTGQTMSVNTKTSGGSQANGPITISRRVDYSKSFLTFGVDDYIEIPDNYQKHFVDLFKYKSFTLMFVARDWRVNGDNVYVNIGPNSQYCGLFFTGAYDKYLGSVFYDFKTASSYSLNLDNINMNFSRGNVVPTFLTVDRNTLKTTITATKKSNVTKQYDNYTPSVTDGNQYLGTLSIGKPSGLVTAYGSFEFYAAAIWDRALADSEINLIQRYYGY